MRNYTGTLTTGILALLVVSLIYIPGCLSLPPDKNSSQPLPATINTTEGLPVPGIGGPVSTTTLDGPANSHNVHPRKKLGLTVNSANQYQTLPGWNNKEGTAIAIINVNITNNLATPYRLERENIYIKTERDTTFEHGGDRMSAEMAGSYLRFPLIISPGETKTGAIIYIVYTGTRINDLVLTDSNDKLIEKVDLNKVYNYS